MPAARCVLLLADASTADLGARIVLVVALAGCPRPSARQSKLDNRKSRQSTKDNFRFLLLILLLFLLVLLLLLLLSPKHSQNHAKASPKVRIYIQNDDT